MKLTSAEKSKRWRERHPERSKKSYEYQNAKHGAERSKRYYDRMREYFSAHPEEKKDWLKKQRPYRNAYMRKNHMRYDIPKLNWIYEQKIHGCEVCGEMDPRCLTFHHKDPKSKKFNMTEKSRSMRQLLEEREKCIIVCANCHAKIHYVDRGILEG